MSAITQPEVIVIGGGPAGSTVSTLIAQQGHKVQLFEREKFPRFHIGESLIPERTAPTRITRRFTSRRSTAVQVWCRDWLRRHAATVFAS